MIAGRVPVVVAVSLWALLALAPAAVGDEPSPLAKSLALDYWDESRFAKFADGVPLSIDEQLEVDRLVERLVGFDRRVFYATPAIELTATQLAGDPDAYRGQLVQLTSQVATIAPLAHEQLRPDDPRPAKLCQLHDAWGEATAATADTPAAWERMESPVGQTVTVTGVFVKLVGNEFDEEVSPLIAAPRLAWYPQEVDLPAVNYGMSILGIMGIDVAMLDGIVHRQPLEQSETAAFYQLLAGMRQSSANELVHWAQRHLPRHRAYWKEQSEVSDSQQSALAHEVLRVADDQRYSVAPFFNTPQQQEGDLAMFDGVVRQALRVDVADDIDAQAAGVDHYYELAVFTDDSQNNPLMFAMLEVPDDLPLGDEVRVPIRAAGFFFKSWRYTSRQSEASAAGRLRFAPLFVGRAPLRIVAPPEKPIWGWVAGLGFIVVVALLWLVGWRRSRADRAFADGTLARVKRPVDTIDYDPEDLPGGRE